MLTAKDLIKYGYFPVEVPPPFQTIKLGEILDKIALSQLEKFINKWQKKDSKNNIPESKCCNYSVPRVKNLRRLISIPNPLYQIILCYYIEKHWKEIRRHIKKSSLSISRPLFPISRKKKESRSFDLVKHNLNYEQELALRSTEFSYILKTDISRYYHTLYTHSISWALHGKDKAKKNRNDPSLYGHHLDKWVRKTRDGQTLGIPIGPDSSIIISEIIATSIDIELKKQMGNDLHGIRIIDDYLLFFKERHECEDALSNLHKIFKSYELEMNPTKIKIFELPYVLEPQWKSDIRQFHFRNPKRSSPSKKVIMQKTDLINYFSRVNAYCRLFPDDNIIKYSMKRFHNKKIFNNNIPLFESLLLKSTLIQSSSIPDVTAILLRNKKRVYKDKNERINRTISELIRIHCKYSNDFEIAWALWLAKELNIEIEKNVYDSLSKIDNPIVVLLILDLRNKELISDEINDAVWKKFLVKEQLYDDHWLLAYEALKKEWLPVSDDYIEDDPFFKELKENDVSFYDPTISEILTIPEPAISGS
ncbi:MAG: RNA-directed DNA polymerase [Methanoregulaceae archaeon]|jgi:hypothetical protein